MFSYHLLSVIDFNSHILYIFIRRIIRFCMKNICNIIILIVKKNMEHVLKTDINIIL